MKTIFLCTIVLTALLTAKNPKMVERSAPSQSNPKSTMLNINKISAWYTSNGESERNPNSGNSGMTYPRGTATAVYASGLMWGGYANDGYSSAPRVNGFAYNSGMTPGAILGKQTGVTEDSTSEDVRIFRIRKDFASADLTQDAAEIFGIPFASVDTGHSNSLRRQYKKDWMEWPSKKGAPFYDAEKDGKYTPKFSTVNGVEIPLLYPEADEPGIAGADQVIWYVANDIRGVESPWKSKPVGLEMQVTLWGYHAINSGLDHTLFKRYRFIYKGRESTPNDAVLSQFYIAHWADPDLGDCCDDFAGCDTVLSTGFVYNSKILDAEYRKFNLAPPAVGYVLLQGPMVNSTSFSYGMFDFQWKKGRSNLPMTAFFHSATGGTYSDPPFNAAGAEQYYCQMQGHPPTPQPQPCPPLFVHPVTQLPTKFWSSGDPVSKTGWIDGKLDNPGDRRLFSSTGPFEMALGDTQEVVYGLVAGLGSDQLSSVAVMKFFIKQVREQYRSMFPNNPSSAPDESLLPKDFILSQNYPNPFNPGTKIDVALPQSSSVTLTVYDGLGRELEQIVNDRMEAGSHSFQWNALRYPSGIYYYRLTAGNFVQTKKMILVK